MSIGDMALDVVIGTGVVNKVNHGGGSLNRLDPLVCVNKAVVEKELKLTNTVIFNVDEVYK